MDFGRAFSYVFEDQDWLKKLAIIGLVGLIPVVGQLVMVGYMLHTLRNVINRYPRPLPDLDFGNQLSLGFKGFLIEIVYGLPIFILYIPMMVLPALMGDGATDETTSTIVIALSVCCGGLMLIYGVAMMFVLPAAISNFVAQGSLGAGFKFKQIFELIKASPGSWLFVLLGTLITSFIAPLGTIACFIGAMLTAAYAMVVNAHFYGQAYNESTQKLYR